MLLVVMMRIFILVGLVSAYPLRSSPIRVSPAYDELDTNFNSSLHLQSIPLSVTQRNFYVITGDTKLAGISSRDLATSLATTVIGGGLALILT